MPRILTSSSADYPPPAAWFFSLLLPVFLGNAGFPASGKPVFYRVDPGQRYKRSQTSRKILLLAALPDKVKLIK
jgi:hypothetical protein